MCVEKSHGNGWWAVCPCNLTARFANRDADEETTGPPGLPPIAISLKERLLGLKRGRNSGQGQEEKGDGGAGGGEERAGLLGAAHSRNISYDSMASVRFHRRSCTCMYIAMRSLHACMLTTTPACGGKTTHTPHAYTG